MKRTQIYLTEEQVKQLKKIAHDEGKTMAMVIRDGADMIIEKRAGKSVKKDDFFESMEASRKKIGFNGPKDLSQNIDKYVYNL